MPDIKRPDCGWVPGAAFIPDDVTAASVEDVNGFNLANKNVMFIDLTDEADSLTITKFVGYIPGKEYVIIIKNSPSKQLVINFPAGTLINGEVTPANGMSVVYKFFILDDGTVYMNQGVYA